MPSDAFSAATPSTLKDLPTLAVNGTAANTHLLSQMLITLFQSLTKNIWKTML